jgi:hypothetical protein
METEVHQVIVVSRKVFTPEFLCSRFLEECTHMFANIAEYHQIHLTYILLDMNKIMNIKNGRFFYYKVTIWESSTKYYWLG